MRRRPRVAPARPRPSCRPALELVEDRLLPATITVTSTGDAVANDGMVTLREAITAANRNANFGDVVAAGAYGADAIAFNLPGSGVRTIAPTSALPEITGPLTIDGYTQAGSSPNTNPAGQGLNGTLLVEISGANAGDLPSGLLRVTGGNSTIRGLILNRTRGAKIYLEGNAGGNRVEGNYLGTDAAGTSAFAAAPAGNASTFAGVFIRSSTGNVIGGTTPAARNLISGNTGPLSTLGIEIGAAAPDTTVQGNLIGTDRTGLAALPNRSGGVASQSDGLLVGGAVPGSENLISGNGGAGVSLRNGTVLGNRIGINVAGTAALGNQGGVSASGGTTIAANLIAFNAASGVSASGVGNRVTANAIFANGVAIDLLGGGHTPNDAVPDADGAQNFPILGGVTASAAMSRVTGTLASKPNGRFRLEFFASATRSGDTEYGEGQAYLGAIEVATDAAGRAAFAADLPALPVGLGYVSATATDITDAGSGPDNSTSEISPAVGVGGASTVVTTTADSGPGSLRDAIVNANLTPGTQAITFAIPANDPRHFYYRNDGVAGALNLANVAATTAADDAAIADIDPDWPHSWYSIAPASALPEITGPVIVDGYSQPGSVRNARSDLGGLTTVLKIELDGTGVAGDGLRVGLDGPALDSSGSLVRGLAINRFGGDGIEISTLDGGVIIAGNFLGTDVSGLYDLGNAGSGVYLILEVGATIGGDDPGDANLIAGNDANGIELREPRRVSIVGNLLGLDRNTQYAVPNGGAAIVFRADARAAGRMATGSRPTSPATGLARGASDANAVSRNNIGSRKDAIGFGLDALPLLKMIGERIAEEGEDEGSVPGYDMTWIDWLKATPVYLRDATPSPRRGAAPAHASNPTAIDLGGAGVTPNDLGDADGGPNGLQNYPVLTSAITTAGTVATGTLNSLPNTAFRLEFYANSICTAYRFGERRLGSIDVTTDANGNASFAFQSPERVPVGQFLTALATRLEGGTPVATSEFAEVIPVTDTPPATAADLAVVQSVSASTIAVGGEFTFTIVVTNAGPAAATGVRLLAAIPAGAAFLSATGGIAPVDGSLMFDLGTIAAGASATVTYTVRADAVGTFVGTATVASDSADPSPGDNATATSATAGDFVGPVVTRVSATIGKGKNSPIVLAFNEALDAGRAGNLGNYRLLLAGRDRKFGTRDDKRVALRSARYDAASRTVTLLARKTLTQGTKYRLIVDGTAAGGLADRDGNLLDGDFDGRNSGNYAVVVRPRPAPKGRRA